MGFVRLGALVERGVDEVVPRNWTISVTSFSPQRWTLSLAPQFHPRKLY